MSFDVLPTAAHVISLDDVAAGALADIVARWVEDTNLAPRKIQSTARESLQSADSTLPPLQLARASRPAR